MEVQGIIVLLMVLDIGHNLLNSEIKTVNVYVGSDGKLHFTNSGGADTVLPFSPVKNLYIQNVPNTAGSKYTIKNASKYVLVASFSSTGGYPGDGTDSPDKYSISAGELVATGSGYLFCALYKDVPAGAVITNSKGGNNWGMVFEMY